MKPRLVIKSQPIDLELCELLGDKPADFLVLCLNGVQLEDFGTPYDTLENRKMWRKLVKSLNDRSVNSRWPDLWLNWKPNICRQFGLPSSTTAADFRPVVSYQISRVCAGYSEHLHAAIGLFEKLGDRVECWAVCVNGGTRASVTMTDTHGTILHRAGTTPSLVIAEAVRDLLKSNERC